VGVVCAHADYSVALKQAGIDITLISAGEGKADGSPYTPLSAAALATIQTEVDRQYGELIGAVAKGRGMKASAVVKLGSRTFNGAADAIASGVADAAGSPGCLR
jgi:capsid assembly protease